MRYFFNLHNDIDTQDEEGVELASPAEARAHAVAEARVMAADSVSKGHLNLAHYIQVFDDGRQALFRVTFGEAVDVIA
jgi:hypothetical protein